jgi:maleylacetate reductase
MHAFTFTAQMPRVLFGAGVLPQLAAEVDRLGARRALVLCTPEQADQAQQVAGLLGARAAGVYAKAVMHVPVETARDARTVAAALGADCAVAVGGGSTVGLGKAIALESALPIIAVPTTYAGSEMTPIYGITEAGVKKTGRDARVLPKTVLYDPQLSRSLPAQLSAASGMNAIAHAAEGLYAHDGNPIVSLMAQEGIAALARALPVLQQHAQDLQARSDALYGAWLCGAVLGHVSMGLHHKLCHTLGGTFNLDHARTHTVVLPYALAYNTAHAQAAMATIAHALQADDAAGGIQQLAQRLNLPTALKDIGMPRQGLARAAELAVQTPYPNPRGLEHDAIYALLQRAYEGSAPCVD